MQRLGLPYRVVRVCLGDLGAPGYKKYDVEGGSPASASSARPLEHQPARLPDRRLNARYKDGKRTVFPHTISATMITDRALLAILETTSRPTAAWSCPRRSALRRRQGAPEADGLRGEG